MLDPGYSPPHKQITFIRIDQLVKLYKELNSLMDVKVSYNKDKEVMLEEIVRTMKSGIHGCLCIVRTEVEDINSLLEEY